MQINTRSLSRNLRNDSKSFAALATKPIGETFLVYQGAGTIRIREQIQNFIDLDSNVTNVTVTDITGRVLFSLHPTTALAATLASSFTPQYQNSNGRLSSVVQPFIEDSGAHRYTLVYAISATALLESQRQIITLVGLFSLIALIISSTLSYVVISYFFITPMRRLSRQALTISAGNWDQDIHLNRQDEMNDLAVAVNHMADALKQDIHKLQETDRLKSEFMMITSHNLRTPLTVITGYTEQLGLLGTKEALQQALAVVGDKAKQLQTFAEDMLTISSFEAGQSVSIQLQPMDLRHFCQELMDEFRPLASTKKIDYKFTVPSPPVWVAASAVYLRSAIWNLLDNAFKFTPERGRIELRLAVAGARAQLSVSDTGIGIAPEEMEKLFTKFHRGTSTLTYDYEGTGIGLYAAKLMIEQMGGTIQARSVLGRGSSFSFSLPLIAPPSQSQ